MKKVRVAAQKSMEIAEIYRHYEAAKKQHHAVDFGDPDHAAAHPLKATRALRAAIQLRHRHRVVDEYQEWRPRQCSPGQSARRRWEAAMGGR